MLKVRAVTIIKEEDYEKFMDTLRESKTIQHSNICSILGWDCTLLRKLTPSGCDYRNVRFWQMASHPSHGILQSQPRKADFWKEEGHNHSFFAALLGKRGLGYSSLDSERPVGNEEKRNHFWRCTARNYSSRCQADPRPPEQRLLRKTLWLEVFPPQNVF